MKSRKLRLRSQSALLAIMALPSEKSIRRAICLWKQAALWSISSVVIIRRISLLPEGSPMQAVPPPRRTMGRWPARCMWAIVISAT